MAVVGAFCEISAAVVAPDPSTVEVESVALIVRYTVPVDDPGSGGGSGGRKIAFLAFGPNRRLVWLRSSGHLDSAEWCPSCSRHVEGTNRDGGLPMPEGFWESARLLGRRRRLSRVDSEREGFQALAAVAFTDRLEGGEGSLAPPGQRWQRFGIRVQGSAHRLRLRIPETLKGAGSVEMVFDVLEGPGR